MKNLLCTMGILLFAVISSFAQAPNGINYQALARNMQGVAIINKNINVRLSIRNGSAVGTIVYQETHSMNSGNYGLLNMQIGKGSVISGDFSGINWGNGTYFLQVEMDPLNGNNFQELGTSQLVSVPYALYANTALNTINGDGDANPTNELQNLSFANHQLSISSGNTVNIPDEVNDADADPLNEIQALSQVGNIISLSKNGGTVTIAPDADADPLNEIQTLSQVGNTISLSKNGGSVTIAPDADADPTNEIQTISQIGNTIILSKNGGSVSIAPDADADPTNEIQQLTLNGNNLSISKGNQVTLPVSNQLWTENVSDIYYDKGKVSIGTNITNGDFTLKGYQSVLSSDNLYRLGLGVYGDKSAFVGLLGADGGTMIGLESDINNPNRGMVTLFKEGNKANLELGCGSKAGYVDLINDQDYLLSTLSYDGAAAPNGYFETNTALGKVQTVLGSTNSIPAEGFIGVYGQNEVPNVIISDLSNYTQHGYVGIFHAGNNVAGIYADASGNGIVYGNIKSFRMPYPGRSGEEIWYASIEGPEAAAYTRGTAKMVNGEATIEFPEHFSIVANANTMTVQTSPLSADSKGIAVIEKTNKGFKVKELFGGTGNYSFDWEVKCVRSGYEDFKVVRSADDLKISEPNMPTKDRGKTDRTLKRK